MPLTSGRRANRATRIAVTSGKGGVGKTTVAINVAVAIAQLGYRVGIVDADFALGNIDVLLGLSPTAHLGQVMAGECGLDDIVLKGPEGLKVLPAGSGVPALATLDDDQWERLSTTIDRFGASLDFMFVDTATGIGDNVLDLVGLTDYALVVTTFDPAALVDAYAMVKLINTLDATREIGVLVNAAQKAEDADLVFRQLSLVARQFLGRSLRQDGMVALDHEVSACGHWQRPVVVGARSSEADRGYRAVAKRLVAWRPPAGDPVADPARKSPAGPMLATRLGMEVTRCA